MAKILLVEDDNNLREIYEMLLSAEGYKLVTASDGEEGLSVALKEKPDLIIADVMMPKLSGFEMLENLKAAPEMKNVKVIMMTALGQAEDQARGSQLGVVKYLVKSQATLEDFARVVKEVLPLRGGQVPTNIPKESSTNNQEGEQTMQEDNSTNMPAGGSDAPADQGASTPPANPMNDGNAGDDQMSTAQEQSAVNDQVNDFAGSSAAPAGDAMASGGTDAPADTSGSFSPATPPAEDTSAGDGTAPTDASGMPPATPPAETPPQSDTPA